jgi:hypothetical protein
MSALEDCQGSGFVGRRLWHVAAVYLMENELRPEKARGMSEREEINRVGATRAERSVKIVDPRRNLWILALLCTGRLGLLL